MSTQPWAKDSRGVSSRLAASTVAAAAALLVPCAHMPGILRTWNPSIAVSLKRTRELMASDYIATIGPGDESEGREWDRACRPSAVLRTAGRDNDMAPMIASASRREPWRPIARMD